MPSLEAARRLADRYVLKERLGDGGHAEVWSALDERSGRLVALKFLHLRCCSAEEALPVLAHEARMAHRLDHPGVLQVEEPQRDGDNVFLLVEYASGGSAARLRGAPWRRLLPVLREVARVLEHAHARGVVHRDIKPGNVLFDAAGQVRVADFGTSARTGSCEAPAAGSPFSASPQQLRDEAASPADDVYGLGALAYELLTRYPPFYPEFDAARVQVQDPPRPVPVQPAPEALLDLVQAMLAREESARPSLEAVMEGFERCLALPESTDEGAVLIEAARQRGTAAAAAKRRVSAWWWLGGTAAAGAAVLLLLPQPQAMRDSLPAESQAPRVANVADAVVREPEATASSADAPGEAQAVAAGARAAAAADASGVAAEAADASAPAAPALPTIEEELRAGEQALSALRPAQARAAFQRALGLQADHAGALAGLGAATRLESHLSALGEGTRAEAAGDLEAAREHFRLLVANQPDFAPARAALLRVDARIAGQQLEDHLAAAADALRRGQVEAAAAAYDSAAILDAREPRVIEGRQRIAEIHRNRQNEEDLATGAALEGAERWDEAVAHYRAVLERDATLRFAQEALSRSERRAALDQELADYLARPERLTAPAVRQSAQRALARGEASAADAPRLGGQIGALRAALGALDVPVSVEITSDNSTRVTVTRVGDLGAFETRALSLPPGHYTVIGRREGFRDVRFELNLAPGQPGTALAVQCTERI